MSAGEAGVAARLALDASLGRLRRQHIDLLQWHNWTRERLGDDRFATAWQTLSADPRCLALGASTYGADDALAAVESGQFAVVQVEWNVLNQSAVRAAAAVARQRGVKLAARSVLLQGVLTDRGRRLPPYLSGLAPWRDKAVSLARSLGMDLQTLSLRAALENPDLSYVLVGVDTRGQVGEHVAAAAVAGPALPWPAIEELHADCDLTDPRRWTGAPQAVSRPT
jgi:aryl-alcohol dehydrogenase-like predicted oxidoreductase